MSSEAKAYDKGHSEYVEDVDRASANDRANEQARLDDAELVAGEATEKVRIRFWDRDVAMLSQQARRCGSTVAHARVPMADACGRPCRSS